MKAVGDTYYVRKTFRTGGNRFRDAGWLRDACFY